MNKHKLLFLNQTVECPRGNHFLVLLEVMRLTLKTILGKSVCRIMVNIHAEALWCRHAGSSPLPTALMGQYLYFVVILFATFLLNSALSSYTFILLYPSWLSPFWHCRNNKVISRWTVMSGHSGMTTAGASYVDKILVNNDYRPEKQDFDIALIRLSSPITVRGKTLY